MREIGRRLEWYNAKLHYGVSCQLVGPHAERKVRITKDEHFHFVSFQRVSSVAISPSGGRYKLFGTLRNPYQLIVLW